MKPKSPSPPGLKRTEVMWRSFGAIFAGCVVASVIITGVQMLGHGIFPPPPKIQKAMTDKNATARNQAIREYLPMAPVGVLLFVPLAWALGSFGGGALTARLAKRRHVLHALIVGVVMMANGVVMLFMLPHPLWMACLGMAVFLPAAWAGGKIIARKLSTPAPQPPPD